MYLNPDELPINEAYRIKRGKIGYPLITDSDFYERTCVPKRDYDWIKVVILTNKL